MILLDCVTVINWGDVPTWIAAIASSIYMVLTYFLWKTSQKAQEDAVIAHSESAQQFTKLNTPWIAVTSIEIKNTSIHQYLSYEFRMIYMNFGATPAENIRAKLSINLDGKPLEKLTDIYFESTLVPGFPVEIVVEFAQEYQKPIEKKEAWNFYDKKPLLVDFVLRYTGVNEKDKICEYKGHYDHDKQKLISDLAKQNKEESKG